MRTTVVYVYDGSFEGLLTCVFESYEKKETPVTIIPEKEEQTTLYYTKFIETDGVKATRVMEGIKKKASSDAFSIIELTFYSCHPEKELLILKFIRLSMTYGKKVLSALTDDTVSAINNAVKGLTREAHQLKGFVRFSVFDNVMTAIIEPKNFVLPLLAPHFADRYANERFLIFDKTHSTALVYKPHIYDIFPFEEFTEPEPLQEERNMRALWKLFYDTIAIKERENPKCCMTHMQKRYWSHLTEMQDAVSEKKDSCLPDGELPKLTN